MEIISESSIIRKLGFKYTHLANIFNIFKLFPKSVFGSSQFGWSFWVSKARVNCAHTHMPPPGCKLTTSEEKRKGLCIQHLQSVFFSIFSFSFLCSSVSLQCSYDAGVLHRGQTGLDGEPLWYLCYLRVMCVTSVSTHTSL